MSEPIIQIVTNDGRRIDTGVKYARGYDGAHAEARELHGLNRDDYRLDTIAWTTGSQLSGCGVHSFYLD